MKIKTIGYKDNRDNLPIGFISGLHATPVRLEICGGRLYSTHKLYIKPGKCIDATGTKIITLNKKMVKDVRYSWQKGNRKGCSTNSILINELWYYIFLIADKHGVDIGIDMNLSAENLLLFSEYKYHRRIGQFQYLHDRIRPFFIREDAYLWSYQEADEQF